MNKLKLTTNIFSKAYIEEAIRAYKDICNIEISEINNYIVCKFTDCIYNTEETIKEFENYVIDLMNTKLAL